jgi:hypothetical protein
LVAHKLDNVTRYRWSEIGEFLTTPDSSTYNVLIIDNVHTLPDGAIQILKGLQLPNPEIHYKGRSYPIDFITKGVVLIGDISQIAPSRNNFFDGIDQGHLSPSLTAPNRGYMTNLDDHIQIETALSDFNQEPTSYRSLWHDILVSTMEFSPLERLERKLAKGGK